MSEAHDKHQPESDEQTHDTRPARAEAIGRIFYFIASGLLLSVMVSCACGPVR